MHKFLIAPALALVVAASAGYAMASDDDGAAAGASRDTWMTTAQITEKLTAAGYDVRRVKEESNGYEVYVIDMDGKKIESEVDPVTGALLNADADD